MLTNHQWGPVMFIWEQLHKGSFRSPRGQWVNSRHLQFPHVTMTIVMEWSMFGMRYIIYLNMCSTFCIVLFHGVHIISTKWSMFWIRFLIMLDVCSIFCTANHSACISSWWNYQCFELDVLSSTHMCTVFCTISFPGMHFILMKW